MQPAPEPDATTVPDADPGAEPDGFVVLVEPADRIHFLDWGGPAVAPGSPGMLLVHGLGQSAWTWAPVARRLRAVGRTVAQDLRGHGLSDAPVDGYDEATLVEDSMAVADGSGLLGAPLVIAGLGFGACVAAWTADRLGDACAGLVLVDGGWEDLPAQTGLDAGEFLRDLDEPPEILRSMGAFLADRAGFDPATWDADQERAARATVVETQAGRVVPATRPHALEGAVRALWSYRPAEVLTRIRAPVTVLAAAEDEERTRGRALAAVQQARADAGLPPMAVRAFPSDGHNLPRYRPREVTAAILGASGRTITA